MTWLTVIAPVLLTACLVAGSALVIAWCRSVQRRLSALDSYTPAAVLSRVEAVELKVEVTREQVMRAVNALNARTGRERKRNAAAVESADENGGLSEPVEAGQHVSPALLETMREARRRGVIL